MKWILAIITVLYTHALIHPVTVIQPDKERADAFVLSTDDEAGQHDANARETGLRGGRRHISIYVRQVPARGLVNVLGSSIVGCKELEFPARKQRRRRL